jgi:predicted metal-dependent hydrolase
MLVVNDLRFEIRRSARRRAMEIIVDRGGELILSAPIEVPDARRREFVQRKRMWIYKQLARKDALAHEAPRKVFVDGEGFAYLGRTYRLRLVAESDVAVKLQGGRFVMPKVLARVGREHLIRWYRERARPWLWSKVQDHTPRMEVDPAGVRVQDLGYKPHQTKAFWRRIERAMPDFERRRTWLTKHGAAVEGR